MPSVLSLEAARRLRPSGAFHLPPPAQPVGSTVTITLERSRQQPEIVFTDERRDLSWRVVMSRVGDLWQAEVMMPMDPTIVRYHFEFPDGSRLYELRQDEGSNTPVYGVWRQAPYQIAVYDPARMPPDWAQGMVIYQIFPDRFANGDPTNDREAFGVYGHEPLYKAWGDTPEHPPLGRDFFGGDLRGVIDKLDYLAELGIECIYFTPIFASPSNHRYDALDFMSIDPMLGTEADFQELLEKAHARGIRIILDAVYNHCSVDSLYFGAGGRYGEIGAVESKESPYYRWFTFTEWPVDWVSWNGLKHMPEFAECPEVEEFFTGPAGPTGKWTRMGVDGWRSDVTGCNSDEFWRRWRRRLDRIKPDNYTVAEEWENASRYLLGDMFSATMNYRFSWALHGFCAYDKLTPSELDDRLQTWLRDTPSPAQKAQMNLLDSHDTGRIMTACMGDRRRFKQMVAFQFAYPGAPMIYYGSETGLEGDYAESGRRTMPWDNLDEDLLAFYKRIVALRRGSNALRLGTVETVVLDDEQRVYGFVRRYTDETIYVLFNGGDKEVGLELPLAEGEPADWEDCAGDHGVISARNGRLHIRLEPRGYAYLRPR
ncbi:MAG: glycoside hydrolase family 13 protein [Chloroflexota bacterium]|nr:MAG: hypothetical protein DIU68_11250 [Chloroflexota bacterium]